MRPTTSAPAPPRRTRRSCTPGSTRCPAAWRAACCAAAARCCADYARTGRHPGRAHRRAAGRLDRRAAPRAAGDRGKSPAERIHRDPPGLRGGPLPAGTPSGAGGAGRAGDPGRERHLPVDHAAGLRHRGGAGRRPARAGHPGHRRAPSEAGGHAAGHHPRHRLLPLARQRGRAGRDVIDAMLGGRRLHDPPPPRRADRVRQAGAAAARLDPAARCRPRRPRACWSPRPCTATCCSGPPRRTSTTGATPPPPRPGWPRCSRPGRRIMPGPGRRGGHRDLRRAARRDRAPRLPDPGGRRPALRLRGRDQVDRAVRVTGHRRVRGRPAGRGRACRWPRGNGPAAPAARCPTSARRATRPYQDAGRIAADPEYGRIVCHCERVTRGEIRDALASTVPPADLDGLRRRTRALNGRCQGFYCAATVAALMAAARPPPAAAGGRGPAGAAVGGRRRAGRA